MMMIFFDEEYNCEDTFPFNKDESYIYKLKSVDVIRFNKKFSDKNINEFGDEDIGDKFRENKSIIHKKIDTFKSKRYVCI